MTAKSIAEMKTEIDTQLPSSGTGAITGAVIRSVLKDLVDTLLNIHGYASYADDEYDAGSPLSLASETATIVPNNAASKLETYKPVDIDTFYSPASLYFDAKTEDFTVGETLTGGTSGATATIMGYRDDPNTANAGILLLGLITGTFTDNETVTGTTTGSATANGSNDVGRIAGKQGDSYSIHIEYTCVPTAAGTKAIDTYFDIQGAIGELYRRTVGFPKGNGEIIKVTSTTQVFTLDTWEGNAAKVWCETKGGTANIYGSRFNIYRESVPVT